MTPKNRHLHEVLPADQVQRWQDLLDRYPQAIYGTDGAWFYGALRDDDNVIQAATLKNLIDQLLGREG